jgi:hypothetical protein
VVVHARLQASLSVTDHCVRRERDDGRALDAEELLVRTDVLRRLETTHDRHRDIHL